MIFKFINNETFFRIAERVFYYFNFSNNIILTVKLPNVYQAEVALLNEESESLVHWFWPKMMVFETSPVYYSHQHDIGDSLAHRLIHAFAINRFLSSCVLLSHFLLVPHAVAVFTEGKIWVQVNRSVTITEPYTDIVIVHIECREAFLGHIYLESKTKMIDWGAFSETV